MGQVSLGDECIGSFGDSRVTPIESLPGEPAKENGQHRLKGVGRPRSAGSLLASTPWYSVVECRPWYRFGIRAPLTNWFRLVSDRQTSCTTPMIDATYACRSYLFAVMTSIYLRGMPRPRPRSAR
jgi:hypothetical protein